MFVSIAFLSALFLNGIYQDGQEKNPYGILLSGLCRVFMVITPIFTAFALFIILFHSNNAIEKNGINTSNFPYFLIISVLFAYNISYAIIAFLQKKPWLKPIEKTNIVLAVILIVLTTATTNPLFFSILPKYKNNGIANNNVIAQQVSKQFNEAGFSWKAMTKNNIPKKALELGYDQKPIYFCRAKKDDHYEGGIVFNNTCKIIDKNHIKKITDFSVLTGPADKIAWLNWRIPMALNNTQSIVTFDSTTPNIPAICRSIYQNHILVGVSTGNNDYNCTAIFRGQIISVKQFVNFLYIIHKTY
ncbi:MAG: hypothetical protein NTU49_02330 [Gammaproteobacteria bacterium]|nr:hypothetical protein [Gammaproteobacteria bacterium]